jgi:microcystin degradation protein MlrC
MVGSSKRQRYRVAIAGIIQESVTFIDELTTLAQFQAAETAGPELVPKYRRTNTPIGGLIDVCEAENAEIVPIFYTIGGAAGPGTDEAYDHYVGRLIETLTHAGDLDGVLLDLHGAMTTPTRMDADAETLERVRAAVGPDTPVMVALDYHANLDERTLAFANAVFGYHYSPHTDMGATGERAARCLFAKLRGEIDPVCAIEKPGVMVPSIFSATGLEPLKSIVDQSVREAAASKTYLDISVFAGFSFADVPNCGFSVVVVTDRDKARAAAIAKSYSDRVYDIREAINHRELVYSVDSALAKAQAIVADRRRPVVLLEHADRMHDSTYLLREVVKLQLPRTIVPYVWDPKAAAAAVEAGVGAKVRLSVGGHTSERAGGPVIIEGEVTFAGPVVYRATGPYFTGRIVNLGSTAVIQAGAVTLSVTSTPATAVDDDCLKQFGQSIDDYDYIVLRSKTHFRAYFEPVAAEILIVDTPDWGAADLRTLPYVHVPTDRIYPFTEKRSSEAKAL